MTLTTSPPLVYSRHTRPPPLSCCVTPILFSPRLQNLNGLDLGATATGYCRR